jgi:hypothetical protein
MDEEIESLVIGVRADVTGFARDVADLRASLEGPLAAGAEKAGRSIEASLLRAARTGRFGFEDLGRVALGVLAEISTATVRDGLASLGLGRVAGSGNGGGALLTLGTGLIGALLGLPGRANGGPVSPMRPYLVGERGPEVFVPTSSGTVIPNAGGRGEARAININIAVAGGQTEAPRTLARSARQVARAVRGAIG